MPYQDIEESRIYQRAERLADSIWDAAMRWNVFARDTLGKQIVRAADSIGANIAESSGRHGAQDAIRFLYYARGSLKETRYWLKRAVQRDLISQDTLSTLLDEFDQLGFELNNYINYQRSRSTK